MKKPTINECIDRDPEDGSTKEAADGAAARDCYRRPVYNAGTVLAEKRDQMLKHLKTLEILLENSRRRLRVEQPDEIPIETWRVIVALGGAADIMRNQIERIEKFMGGPTKTGDLWTQEEDAELEKLFESGMTVSEMAAAHQRTPIAIALRLVSLGLIDLNLVTGNPDEKPAHACDVKRRRRHFT